MEGGLRRGKLASLNGWDLCWVSTEPGITEGASWRWRCPEDPVAGPLFCFRGILNSLDPLLQRGQAQKRGYLKHEQGNIAAGGREEEGEEATFLSPSLPPSWAWGPWLSLQMGHNYTRHNEITFPRSVSLFLGVVGGGLVYHLPSGKDRVSLEEKTQCQALWRWSPNHAMTGTTCGNCLIDLSIMVMALCFLKA